MTLHLLFWKYAPWIFGEIQKVYPQFLNAHKLNLPLPVGISFFTLQGIAYLVDLGRRQAPFIAFKDYLLFKSFFPQLVAGPIVRARQLIPQFSSLHNASTVDFEKGLALFSLGFFKKMFIADRSAQWIDVVFNAPQMYSRETLIMTVLGYSVQIWADFSGYTDMGRGSAMMLGIRLPENFLSPYLAQSPSEFWRRWHITLSEWIRDYIYIPLGGNSGGKLRTLAVVLITMFISGLWHGANWTFVIWGIYHGVLLISERFFKKINLGITQPRSNIFQFFFSVSSALLTFSLIAFGWLIFRVSSLSSAQTFIQGIINTNHSLLAPSHIENFSTGLALCILLQVFSYKNLRTNSYPCLDFIKARAARLSYFYIPSQAYKLALGCALAGLLLVAICFRADGNSAAFIYFKF